MSDFRTDLKAALVDELNIRWDGGVYGSICPQDIVDIRVSWDDGERYSPTFKVEVSLSGSRYPVRVSPEWMLSALLRAVLAIGDQR
ncbi:hypothetical protein [Mycobacteroides abscessus]|uniref:hypothetical protein n=1 Tax=Mycobacteroides abscessus TaxID=36809 RepID=UPI0009A62246|nr:hypothetical protein [Mycobacteroides abscessus]SKT21874.1 Uncharacterised protein [Mycobacteroides abscessus subsp. bolletii]